MNRTGYIFSLLLVVFLCTCKEDDFLTVETMQVNFTAEQSYRTISCSSNAHIEAVSSQPQWCTLKVAENNKGAAIEINVSRNATVGQERTATVTVSAGKADAVQIEVIQASATPLFSIAATDAILQFTPQAAQRRLTVNANVPFTAVPPAQSWCSVDIDNNLNVNNLLVSVAENLTSARSAEIVLTAAGFDDLKIKVQQAGTVDDKPGMNIKGVVTCNDAGMSGVVVSDGYEVTTTDANGVYYLSSEKKNEMVFISIPGNYEPPVTDNNPQFFKRLTAGVEQTERIDFELMPANNDKHVVLAVADPQLANRTNDLAQFNTCLADINSVIDSYQSAGTKTYILTLGDMTWDAYWVTNNWALPQYAALMKNFKTSVFNSIGNHDHNRYISGDWASEQTYRSILGPNWYSFNLGKVHYVVLDNNRYINNGAGGSIMGDGTYDGFFPDYQIEWLKKDLATITDKSTPLMVAVHIPVYRPPDVNNATGFYMSSASAQTLVNCLTGFSNVIIMSGHRHFNYRVDPLPWLMEHNIGAICATWWWTGNTGHADNHICMDGSVGGYEVYEINGKDIQWYYKSVGYERDYQFRTYDLNSIHITAAKYAPSLTNADLIKKAPDFAFEYGTQHNGNEVLLNVWGYDKDWKVEVTEGSVTLPTTRVSVRDPLHVISYNFSRLNRNAEPSSGFVTQPYTHFFKVTANSPTSTLNIKVTDRFGKMYTETMTRPKELNVNMR